MKKIKNKIIFISLLLAIIVLSAVKLYDTYATGESQDPNDTYTFNLTGDTTVNIPRFSYKDIIYQIHNDNNGTVQYGIGYTSTSNDIRVRVWNNSVDSATGTVGTNNYKYLKIRIENYSDSSETVTLSTILGYENGGNLVVPSGTILVTETTDGTYTMNKADNTTYFYINDLARANIESIEYVKLSDMPVNTTTSNISSDNSVRLWYELNSDTNLYKVYIGTLTGKVMPPQDMKYMFSGLTNIAILDLSSIDTSSVTNMSYLFYNSSGSGLEELDLSGFNTENVTNYSSMFSGCSSIEYLDVSNFDTKGVTSLAQMFINLTALKRINLSNFKTDTITNMGSMFSGCGELEEIDLSSFNTERLENTTRMFLNCRKLRIADLHSFTSESLTSIQQMFYNNKALTKLDISSLDLSNISTISSALAAVPAGIEIIVENCSDFRSAFGNNYTNVHLANGTSCSA